MSTNIHQTVLPNTFSSTLHPIQLIHDIIPPRRAANRTLPNPWSACTFVPASSPFEHDRSNHHCPRAIPHLLSTSTSRGSVALLLPFSPIYLVFASLLWVCSLGAGSTGSGSVSCHLRLTSLRHPSEQNTPTHVFGISTGTDNQHSSTCISNNNASCFLYLGSLTRCLRAQIRYLPHLNSANTLVTA